MTITYAVVWILPLTIQRIKYGTKLTEYCTYMLLFLNYGIHVSKKSFSLQNSHAWWSPDRIQESSS